MVRKLSEEEVKRELENLEGWEFCKDYIQKEFSTKNWKTTIFVVNAIASLAEAQWHHPDLEVSFKKVKVKLTTHEAGGITERDIKLAKSIDELVKEILKH
ncbi:4a-hydroxytetrahydrobiopterin dehydratase [Aquifex aeolicus]|uniref:Putative pterin-4-alpha-carbinolamine dehydratase n=1 Tax=Aquifex aeolicus (strain VF5) TaxID=224324 RepID=PHS_AQUAE|nr:4a-hydroxytetrahydrobiopterin dehydratase [Aquifex aeolicus]O66462.1 RecName: Full=Putative pterin-4-alpha-carbinolamine dehydratase; Short=PHS; AltName: Full=4-alpha-hydroxy-tetrahydropterin dehydratase; AltName: Full=Pterin carbinolamine dehydratase; Short=PCD [Aquifex aeolicus VF5]AAC06420.1 pterin-4a-carbinolamine dehydratase [Aquifex aeolicus VF5]